MRYVVLPAAAIIFMAAAAALAPVPPAAALTLEEAVAAGLKNNPEMQAVRLEKEAARGQMEKAKLPPFSNPVIEGSLSRKTREAGEPGGPYRNNQVSLSQSVEVAGQRGLRIDAAANNMDKTRLDVLDSERRLTSEIRDAFARSLYLRDRDALAREHLRIREELARLVAAKYEAGDVAALEVNLSRVELARAERDVLAASTEYANSLLALATLIGAPADSALTVEGELAAGLPALPEKQSLVALAPGRPDVRAQEAEVRRSQAAEKLARREAVPSVTWGLFTGRSEGGSETGGTLGITIPLFDRKQGERTEAKARLAQARIREAAAARTARNEIDESYMAAASAYREVAIFKQAILGLTTENLDLLQLAFKEGKIGFYDVRVAQRETIDTRSAYLASLLAARQAYNALERAIGGELR